MAVVVYLREENYEKVMREEVLPYLERIKVSGYARRIHRRKIYYEGFLPEEFQASVILLHGYSECMEKYKEAAYYFVQHGYRVFLMDQVGHGKSYRYVEEDPYLIHVDHFEEYVIDVHYMIESVVKGYAADKPIYLYGHSMGGAVAAYYLELYPNSVKKAVLSSPMMKMRLGRYPELFVRVLAGFKVRRGHKYDHLNKTKSYKTPEGFEKSSAASRARYLYTCQYIKEHKEYQTCDSSYGWVYQAVRACRRIISPLWASRIKADVLLCQAGRDMTVKNGGQNKFLTYVKHARLEVFPDSGHEIFMGEEEQIRSYWNKIFMFLES